MDMCMINVPSDALCEVDQEFSWSYVSDQLMSHCCGGLHWRAANMWISDGSELPALSH